ncbi:hypothetical protein DDA93_01580 [Arthrobacter sp. Bz4]|nr:hypothetical protein DDA93_01580 [Arthrobacter sp. Bz4]
MRLIQPSTILIVGKRFEDEVHREIGLCLDLGEQFRVEDQMVRAGRAAPSPGTPPSKRAIC